MHWILQENLINPVTFAEVARLLSARGIAYTPVRLVPILNELDHAAPSPSGQVFVYGSTGLGHVARAQGWRPGYFEENLDYALMLANLGSLALNDGAEIGALGTVAPRWDRFFVRPILDDKSFAGTVMSRAQFEDFRSGVAEVAADGFTTLRPEDFVAIAPLAEIEAEYRFFVIGGEIVTGSLYKHGDRLRLSADISPAVLRFAQACLTHWQPNAAFALDVAVTEAGPRALEVNSANSAGFYACDIGRIIDAVETLA